MKRTSLDSPRRARLFPATVVAALLLKLLSPGSSLAITNGQFDGNGHPSVGTIVVQQ